jgi:dihydroorotate dehydrogenase
MYKYLIKPLFFSMSPEKAHYFAMACLTLFAKIPLGSFFLRLLYHHKNTSLEQTVMGLKFPNPVGLAAGFDKDARWIRQLSHLGFGFIEIGTLTPKAQPGNPKPRLFRLIEDKGLINRMGFNNDGVIKAVDLLKNKKNILVGGNIGKNTATPNDKAKEDYIHCFQILHPYVDYFVVNVSCPNIKNLDKLQDKDFLVDLLLSLQQINQIEASSKPILLKIAPNQTTKQLDETIDIVSSTNIAGVIATNTTTHRRDLKTTQHTLDKIGQGGLSGQPLADNATQTIRYLRKNTGQDFVIIGVGGIHSPEEAQNKIDAGANLIQIYTGFIYEGPGLIKKINKQLVLKKTARKD